jgi:predicted ribonuclease toxin of YeeF-YezG toxin-antitoxin module
VWRAFPLRMATNGDMEMNTRATKVQAADNDLIQLMADVTRAMEKAQEAISKITSKAAGDRAETKSTTSSR